MSNLDTKDREIVVNRVFDAPREMVFDAWMDEDVLAKWWGPNGFTITTKNADIREGGVWEFTMHGPDGTDYPNKIVYVTIKKPELIIFNHGAGAEDHFTSTVIFKEEGKKTNLTMTLLFPTIEGRKIAVEKYGAIEGGKQTLGRLAEYLDSKK